MLAGIIHLCIAGMFLISGGCTGTLKNTDNDMVLKISHYKVPCMGEGIQLCFRIEKDGGRPEHFYDEIEGFAFEWGYRYTISVEKRTTDNPMADKSSLAYKLKKVLRKEKVSPLETFELPLTIDGQGLIENKEGKCNYFGAIGIRTGNYSCDDLVTGQSGVFHYENDGKGLVLVKVK